VISFELHGDPVGWQRTGLRVIVPRFTKPFASIYTPKETRQYQAAIGMAAKVAMQGKPLFDGPVTFCVTAFMRVPRSWSNKKRDAALAGTIRPAVKPDFDNIGKNVADALKDIVWKDDVQVVDGRVIKIYDERPRLLVEIAACETGDLL
jgi:Holliday junction resolvase RusA-like endonuclease